MDFQFVLPANNADLLNSGGDCYYVKQVYAAAEIGSKLLACKQMVQQGDPFYIFDHFDTYFTVIENQSDNSGAVTHLMRSFDLLYATVDKVAQRLTVLLTHSEVSQTMTDRHSYLNLTKMTLFLLINTVKRLDTKVTQAAQQQVQQKKRRKRAETLEQYPDWDQKRAKFIIQLYNVLQLQLEKLWSPPVAEDNFVELVCDICYRTLEIIQPRAENRNVIDTVFRIFGIAIKRYNHALTFPVRILQILRTVEHAAVSIATGIHLLHDECGISSIFTVLIKDIVEAVTLDSGDSTVSRNFSNFLMEMGRIASKIMIPHLSNLGDDLLSCESHMLRNSILQIMGDAVIHDLTSEELSDELKEARDEFLESLYLHINDVSAHVRARVLQIWAKIKGENAVPLSFQKKVLCEAIERLEDKTPTVRRHAVQLIKLFLERNPFSPKLSLGELQQKHEEECAKMDKLNEVMIEERKKADELEKQWEFVAPEILPFVEQNVKQGTEDFVVNTQEAYENMVERISALLIEKKYNEAVVLLGQAEYVVGNAQLRHTWSPDEQCAYYMALLKSYTFIANGCTDNNEALGTQIKIVTFLQDCIEFTQLISKAVPKIQEFLLSKTNSDVFEAVDFFKTGHMFHIKGTEGGMLRMLYLVWSSDKEKREAVKEAYGKVLFESGVTGRAHSIQVVQNLMCFLEKLEYGHYTAMEFLVREWVSDNRIDSQIIQVLFERFTLKLEGTTENESKLALRLLIMTSKSKSTIASANINVIGSIGLGERARKDPSIYASCLEFMLNSIDASLHSKFYKRHEPDIELVQKVIDVYKKFFFHRGVPDFDNITMRALDFIYLLCQKPDIICERIVMDLHKKFQEVSIRTSEVTESQRNSGMETPFSQQIPGTQPALNTQQQHSLPVYLLSRFIFLIGYMTMKELTFLDFDVYNNMQFRQELTDCEEKKKKTAFYGRRKTGNLIMSATESLKRLSVTATEQQQEPDEDLVGATAEDNIAELINHICENVLFYAENALLQKIIPFVMEICKFPVKYRSQFLQQAATLAFIRFMCVSSAFCEKNMPFLMNILTHTKNIAIKCNIVIGLSDLTFRFPNIIEPWMGHIYSTLHEKDNELRLTAVKMLSHLILNDMIRVRGQIADLAMCIADADDEIKNITQQFFKEIANKSNELYNVLPDIISKLSDTNLNLEEEKYRVIMRYILGLIQKDRQVETLVEKLCQRFPMTREERQWRDIAFCLSLLTYNERSVKKLMDNVQHFKDKVQIDEVYQSFKLIINNASKMAKPELKTAITELETRIDECLEVRDAVNGGGAGGGESSAGRQEARPSRNKTGVARSKTRRGRGRGRGPQTKTSSESSSSEDEMPKAKPPTRGPAQQQRGRVPPKSSSESSSTEQQPRLGKAGTSVKISKVSKETLRPTAANARSRTGARYKVIEESVSSDDYE